MGSWIIAISFLILGILATLFIHRILPWWQRVGGDFMLRLFPWLNFSGKNIDEMMDDWNKSRLHIYDTIIIWGIRIGGILLALGGALLLLALIGQS